MKKIRLFLILITLNIVAIISYGQPDYQTKYNKADSLIKYNQLVEGYLMLKELESIVPKTDTLYENTLWYLADLATHLESFNRSKQAFKISLNYGFEALDYIRKGIPYFEKKFADRESYMIKNNVVSYFGLGNYTEGQAYKKLLYQLNKDKKLPEGLADYFNFEYFKLNNKNIWGYEWFDDLPKDRFSSSFTKIVYYVYSTNPDGSDKDQLYRLHVLMFHGENNDFDYVLDKRFENENEEIAGTFYSYTYKENIDFEKLHNDVIQIIKDNLEPDTKRTKSKKKEGEVKVEMKFK